jgi:hypothetical protein
VGNNPVNWIDPTGHRPENDIGNWIDLRFRMFIPMASVWAPFATFQGDNRGSCFSCGTDRVHMNLPIDLTHQTLKCDCVVSPTHKVGSDDPINNPPSSSFGISNVQWSDDGVTLNLSGNEKNHGAFGPTSATPGITYNFTVQVTKDGDVHVTGEHDQFPAYEIWKKTPNDDPQRLYLFNPVDEGTSPLYLMPPYPNKVVAI